MTAPTLRVDWVSRRLSHTTQSVHPFVPTRERRNEETRRGDPPWSLRSDLEQLLVAAQPGGEIATFAAIPTSSLSHYLSRFDNPPLPRVQ